MLGYKTRSQGSAIPAMLQVLYSPRNDGQRNINICIQFSNKGGLRSAKSRVRCDCSQANGSKYCCTGSGTGNTQFNAPGEVQNLFFENQRVTKSHKNFVQNLGSLPNLIKINSFRWLGFLTKSDQN